MCPFPVQSFLAEGVKNYTREEGCRNLIFYLLFTSSLILRMFIFIFLGDIFLNTYLSIFNQTLEPFKRKANMRIFGLLTTKKQKSLKKGQKFIFFAKKFSLEV
jgi:hypothetical protein